jgi:GAF domain-containing protein
MSRPFLQVAQPEPSPTALGLAWRQVLLLSKPIAEEQTMAHLSGVPGLRALLARRSLIFETVAQLGLGNSKLWLSPELGKSLGISPEAIENLPVEMVSLFSPQSCTKLMEQACSQRQTSLSVEHDYPESAEGFAALAVPLLMKEGSTQGNILLGVLQVERDASLPFSPVEIELIEGIAIQVVFALQADSHMATERWRLEQLALVRQVSAQIANLRDLDLLARRVTSLILETFDYYYVGIFTLEPGQSLLTFRASAGPAGSAEQSATYAPLEFTVQIGQGIIGQVALTGQEILAGDVTKEPRYRYEDSVSETRSELVIPLMIEDRLLGVLDVQSNLLYDFSEVDLLVLRTLASNIAVAVEGAALYEQVRKRAEELANLVEIGNAVNSILDQDEMLDQVVRLVQQRFGYPYVRIFIVHPVRRKISLAVGTGLPGELLQGHEYSYELDDPQGIIPWVARQAETVLANDVSQEPRYRPSPFQLGQTRAELAVPLVFGGEMLGVLDVQSDRRGAFGEDAQALFEALAVTISIALHNAVLYRSEQWRRRVADSLRQVAGLLSADTSLDQVLQAILVELRQTLPCDLAAIWLLGLREASLLLDEQAVPPLQLAAVHGDVQAVRNLEAGMSLAQLLETGAELVPAAESDWLITWLSEALHAPQPILRAVDAPRGPLGALLQYSQEHSALAAPLRVGDQTLGLLTMMHQSPRRYGNEATAMTAAFASYASVAIENTRLYEAAHEQAWIATVLLQVAEAIQGIDNLQDMLDAVVHIPPTLAGIKACALYLLDEQGNFIPTVAGGLEYEGRREFERWRISPQEVPALQRLIVKRELAVIGQDSESTLLTNILTPRQEAEASTGRLLLVPLLAQGELLGAFVVYYIENQVDIDLARMESPSSDEKLAILQGIARQTAVAIQNVRLRVAQQDEIVRRERIARELQLAQEIQRGLLPQELPSYPGWDVAARWQPAREVGGDYYDYFTLPGGKLGLVIADVADKGMPAALFMAHVRTLVRATALTTSSPSAVLALINDSLATEAPMGMFVTLFYGVLNPRTGRLVYANAGHNPPLWFQRARHELVNTAPGGMALGILEGARLQDHRLVIQPGDLLLLYTDGVTEAFSPDGELFDLPRLLETIRQQVVRDAELDAGSRKKADRTVADILDAIEAAVYQFIEGAPLTDDLTLVGIKRITGRGGDTSGDSDR